MLSGKFLLPGIKAGTGECETMVRWAIWLGGGSILLRDVKWNWCQLSPRDTSEPIVVKSCTRLIEDSFPL